jgi:hypothetical protein
MREKINKSEVLLTWKATEITHRLAVRKSSGRREKAVEWGWGDNLVGF